MDDFDDELLGLAEGTSTKRKPKSSAKAKPSKRKRAASADSASDMDMSSDDDDAPPARKPKRDDSDEEQEQAVDPRDEFPLEGKFRDRDDRRRVMAMSEVEREAVLAERLEAISQATFRAEVGRRTRQAQGGDSDDDDDVKRSSRNRKAVGTTSERAKTLDKLKAKRQEKGKKKGKQDSDDDDDDGSSRHRKSSGDEYSDTDDERDARKAPAAKSGKRQAELVDLPQLKDMMVTRARLAEFCAAPWFDEWVKGAWVRYLVGSDRGEPKYRLCEVTNIKEVPSQPYRFENVSTNIQLELKHGTAVKHFPMDAVSNSPCTDSEFGRLARTLEFEKLHLPTVKESQRVKANLEKRKDYIMTEADVAAVLAKKGSRVNPAAGKARLMIQRDFARQTGDQALLDEVNAELAKLEAPPPSPGSSETEQERMRKVNERNRATNREEIKRAEGKAQDERRRQAAALARGDSDVKVDPSARVKTMTRLKYDFDTPSRPGTPVQNQSNSQETPDAASITAADKAIADNSRAKGSKFEEMVAAQVDVEVDLDF